MDELKLIDIGTKCFIMSLFIRDDGERFLLGDGFYEFKDSQLHFASNSIENDVVSVQGNDGYLLAGQVRRPTTQSFDGYIGDATVIQSQIESYRREFFKFFQKNHFYTVIYIMPDGSAIQRRRGFIVDAPEVKEIRQLFPEYHIALNFEDVNYYKYSENPEGDENYSKMATVGLSTSTSGGLVWDSLGVVWDEYGAVWEDGTAGGATTITVDSISEVYPVLTIQGPARNPIVTNLTNGTSMSFGGNITASQTLKIDMLNQTATLNGTSVLARIYGDWIRLEPGNNRAYFSADNSDAPNATLEWQEVVG